MLDNKNASAQLHFLIFFRCQRNTGGPFIREVCLLTSPETAAVPKGMARVQLLSNGYIISGVQFQKHWNAQQVLQHIRSIYESKLQLNTSNKVTNSEIS